MLGHSFIRVRWSGLGYTSFLVIVCGRFSSAVCFTFHSRVPMIINKPRAWSRLHLFLCQVPHGMANLLLHAVNLGHTACVLFVKLLKSLPQPIAITRHQITDPFVKLEFRDRSSVLCHDLPRNVSCVQLYQPNFDAVDPFFSSKGLKLIYSYLKLCPLLFICVLVIYL